MSEETPVKPEQKTEEEQPLEFHAILTPNEGWKIKCVLLSDPKYHIVMKGVMDDLHDTVKIILAQQMAQKIKNDKPRIIPNSGGIINFARKRFKT